MAKEPVLKTGDGGDSTAGSSPVYGAKNAGWVLVSGIKHKHSLYRKAVTAILCV